MEILDLCINLVRKLYLCNKHHLHIHLLQQLRWLKRKEYLFIFFLNTLVYLDEYILRFMDLYNRIWYNTLPQIQIILNCWQTYIRRILFLYLFCLLLYQKLLHKSRFNQKNNIAYNINQDINKYYWQFLLFFHINKCIDSLKMSFHICSSFLQKHTLQHRFEYFSLYKYYYIISYLFYLNLRYSLLHTILNFYQYNNLMNIYLLHNLHAITLKGRVKCFTHYLSYWLKCQNYLLN